METKNQTLPQISRILVAIDFSDQSSQALDWARSLADAFGAQLVLLHVIDIFSLAETGCLMAGSDPLHLVREQAQQLMDALKRLMPKVEMSIREASPRPTIVDAAVELNCQMIIMGTHGRSGLAHLLLGSVAEYVVRNSRVPVLTVRAHIEKSQAWRVHGSRTNRSSQHFTINWSRDRELRQDRKRTLN